MQVLQQPPLPVDLPLPHPYPLAVTLASPDPRPSPSQVLMEGPVLLCASSAAPMTPRSRRTCNPTRARALRQTKVNNAVHCTDLPEDGPLEVDYFFGILQQ